MPILRHEPVPWLSPYLSVTAENVGIVAGYERRGARQR
jgi:hypothetical protein